LRWVAGLIWLILLGFAMLMPGEKFPEIHAFDFQDKLIHTVLFFILSFIWAGVRLKEQKPNWLLFSLLVVLPSILFEIGQYWIPNRSLDLWDLVFNQIGVWAGLLGYFKISSKVFRLD